MVMSPTPALVEVGGASAADGARPEKAGADSRVLDIRTDEAGERWRTVPEAHAASREVAFEDWPIDGGRSAQWTLKMLRRGNKSFLGSHTDWVKNSGVRATDRAVHEHAVLSKALETAVSWDQLNITNCACMEVLIKRRMLLEDAYKGRPEAPRFEGAEHFMGWSMDEGGEIVDPDAVRVRSNRLKEETAVLRELRLKREESEAGKKK